MGIGIALVCGVWIKGDGPIVVWNASPSIPIGLYRISPTPVVLGDVVLLRLPFRSAALAARRGYLARAAYLAKPVAAVAGDTVCRYGTRILVRGRVMARARLLDRAGRPMPTWHGCRTLRLSELFLLSESPDSFDSRYFGPVSTPARPIVLIWSAPSR